MTRRWYKITATCRHSGLSGRDMQCWALSRRWSGGVGQRVSAPFLGSQGPCTTSTDAGVRENHRSLPLGTKAVGSLGHQMVPCVILQSYPTYVRCWLPQSSHGSSCCSFFQPKEGKQAHWFGRPSEDGVHLAQVILLPDTSRSAGPGSTGLGASRKVCTTV